MNQNDQLNCAIEALNSQITCEMSLNTTIADIQYYESTFWYFKHLFAEHQNLISLVWSN